MAWQAIDLCLHFLEKFISKQKLHGLQLLELEFCFTSYIPDRRKIINQMKHNKEISFSIDKKLIFLVMIVSIVTISASAYLSFTSATEVLQERMEERLLSESTLRGNSVLSFIHTRIKETQVISTDPMIRNLVTELNGIH